MHKPTEIEPLRILGPWVGYQIATAIIRSGVHLENPWQLIPSETELRVFEANEITYSNCRVVLYCEDTLTASEQYFAELSAISLAAFEVANFSLHAVLRDSALSSLLPGDDVSVMTQAWEFWEDLVELDALDDISVRQLKHPPSPLRLGEVTEFGDWLSTMPGADQFAFDVRIRDAKGYEESRMALDTYRESIFGVQGTLQDCANLITAMEESVYRVR